MYHPNLTIHKASPTFQIRRRTRIKSETNRYSKERKFQQLSSKCKGRYKIQTGTNTQRKGLDAENVEVMCEGKRTVSCVESEHATQSHSL